MKISFPTALIISAIWFALALAIDRWAVQPVCDACTNFLALSFQLDVPGIPGLSFPHVGLLILIGIPLVAAALLVLPWKKPISDKAAWSEAINTWCKPLWLTLLAVGFTVAGEALYLLAGPHVSEGVAKVLEAFSLKLIVSINGHD